MKFVDEATLTVQAGNGGSGSRSFRREKYVPLGGPDGGDGGDGGHVYLQAASGLNTLVDFRYIRSIQAEHGEDGKGRQQTGRGGESKYVRVPVGTLVYDAETGELLGDLSVPGESFLVAAGGRRGLGNLHFKSSTNRAPRKCTPGKPGERRELKLELKLLAHVGLLGLPNAGKSTFLRSVSSAKPKVADYPFTTLHPGLGTVQLDTGKSFVIADIPGLIEGASVGAGLGFQFLRHLSRNHLLLHIVDVVPFDETPIKNIQTIQQELLQYDPELAEKPQWIVLNKIDCIDSEALEVLKSEVQACMPANTPIFAISAHTKEGTNALAWAIMNYIIENEPVVEALPEISVEEEIAFEEDFSEFEEELEA